MVKRVLLIDDDNITHTTMKNTLNIFKYSLDANIILDHTSSVSEAEHKIKSKKYDLILLDYFIKGKTTEKLLCYIKNISPKTKINIVTSIRDYAILKKLLKSGASRIIYKPMTWKDIFKNMRDNLISINKKETENEFI